jgi:hypothetical protein
MTGDSEFTKKHIIFTGVSSSHLVGDFATDLALHVIACIVVFIDLILWASR